MNMVMTPGGLLDDMAVLTDATSSRISSWDRTGRNKDYISMRPGETATIMDVAGAGCIRKLYFTVSAIDRLYLRRLVIRFYWDGEERPSVEVPLGDFFGLGHCKTRYFSSLLIATNNGSTIGLNSYFPMPFGSSARIELENQSELLIPCIWFHIDFDSYSKLEERYGRFHAQWRRENPTTAVEQPQTGVWQGSNLTGEENYVILEAEGPGQYVGFILNVDNIQGDWWGEGDDMVFIDDEQWPPSYHGTGTEEIFGGGACPKKEYAGLYSGFHIISNEDFSGKSSMYRFFACDPIRFRKSIRATIEHGHNNDFSNDYSSTAFWYQREPHREQPELLPVGERLPRMPDSFWAVYQRLHGVLARYQTIDQIFEDQSEQDVEILKRVLELAEGDRYDLALEQLDRLS